MEEEEEEEEEEGEEEEGEGGEPDSPPGLQIASSAGFFDSLVTDYS